MRHHHRLRLYAEASKDGCTINGAVVKWPRTGRPRNGFEVEGQSCIAGQNLNLENAQG
jgi:hypothetical protein